MPRSICVTLCALLAIGCSEGHGAKAVTGAVLYKGQPVAGATVNFLVKGDVPGAKPARGMTDASGRFKLKTFFTATEEVSGSLPGEYVVTVTKIDEPQGIYDPHKDPPLKNHLPRKYGEPHTSPLTATVKPSGSNHFELKIED